MLPLFRSLDSGADAGAPLPAVWQTFEDNDIRFHRGELSMVAGPPGAGKSVLALQFAIQAKAPTLYVSCDMGRFQTSVRAASVIAGKDMKEVKQEMLTKDGREKYRGVLADEIDHLYMAYESRPGPEDIQEIEMAFEEMWGIPPECLIIDNLMNLYSGSDNEWTGLRDLSQVFHYFATDLGSAVILLHHTKIMSDPTIPGPMGSVKGQIQELPALILTTAKAPEKLRISAVKNRNGQADPTGRNYVELDWDQPKGILSDPKPPEPVWASAPDWFNAYKD